MRMDLLLQADSGGRGGVLARQLDVVQRASDLACSDVKTHPERADRRADTHVHRAEGGVGDACTAMRNNYTK